MPTLDGQGLQALLVAGQVALEEKGEHVEVGESHRDTSAAQSMVGHRKNALGMLQHQGTAPGTLPTAEMSS